MELWQERLFTQTFSLWIPLAVTLSAAGRASETTYSLSASGVSGYIVRNPSTSDTDPALGRFEADMIFTQDIFWFDISQTIDEKWVIVNKTVMPNGVNHPDYGKGWITRGQPRRQASITGVGMGHTEIYGTSLPVLPSGVS